MSDDKNEAQETEPTAAPKAPASKSSGAKSSAAKTATAKTATVKTATAKTAARKPAARKSATGNPVAEKSVAEKPAAPKARRTKATASETAPSDTTTAQSTANPGTKPSDDGMAAISQDVSPQSDETATANFWQQIGIRALFMILFGVLAWVSLLMALGLSIVQWLVTALTGEPNAALSRWIGALGTYIGQALAYLGFDSDEQPFPLGKDFPLDD